jgi:soluble lytic murein transglycosylase
MTAQGRLALAVAAAAVLLVGLVALGVERGAHSRRLPLTDAGIIREQAAAKHIDPALVAAVIYTETRFNPRPSAAGAEGLMQILPATAYFLAQRSGGTAFTATDLATPRVNVAYGSYYLRYLLDHYGDNETLALAAYNGGLGNVDSWLAKANAAGEALTAEAIPFPETREYVVRVENAQREYRAEYPRELGLQ